MSAPFAWNLTPTEWSAALTAFAADKRTRRHRLIEAASVVCDLRKEEYSPTGALDGVEFEGRLEALFNELQRPKPREYAHALQRIEDLETRNATLHKRVRELEGK